MAGDKAKFPEQSLAASHVVVLSFSVHYHPTRNSYRAGLDQPGSTLQHIKMYNHQLASGPTQTARYNATPPTEMRKYCVFHNSPTHATEDCRDPKARSYLNQTPNGNSTKARPTFQQSGYANGPEVCDFCHKKGHHIDDCRTYAKRLPQAAGNRTTYENSMIWSPDPMPQATSSNLERSRRTDRTTPYHPNPLRNANRNQSQDFLPNTSRPQSKNPNIANINYPRLPPNPIAYIHLTSPTLPYPYLPPQPHQPTQRTPRFSLPIYCADCLHPLPHHHAYCTSLQPVMYPNANPFRAAPTYPHPDRAGTHMPVCTSCMVIGEVRDADRDVVMYGLRREEVAGSMKGKLGVVFQGCRCEGEARRGGKEWCDYGTWWAVMEVPRR